MLTKLQQQHTHAVNAPLTCGAPARQARHPLKAEPHNSVPCGAARQLRGQSAACRAFLSNVFGGGRKKEASSPAGQAEQVDLGPDQDEVLLAETARDDGSSARIIYRNNIKVDARTVEDLCAKVGWPARPVRSVETALRNSYLVGSLHMQLLYADGSKQESLIGLGRATSDTVFNATIWDVVVDPEFQGQGLGKALVQELTKTLLRRGISNITLFADSHVVDFYRQLGFETDLSNIKGMFWYNK